MKWSRGEGRIPHPTPCHGVGRLCPHTGLLLSHTSSFLLTSFLTVLPHGGVEGAPHHGRCKRRTGPPDGIPQTCLLCGTRAQGAVTLPRTPNPAERGSADTSTTSIPEKENKLLERSSDCLTLWDGAPFLRKPYKSFPSLLGNTLFSPQPWDHAISAGRIFLATTESRITSYPAWQLS